MFTWIPIYKELAKRIIEFKDRQAELIDFMKEAAEKDIPIISLKDRDEHDQSIDLDEIDPFTFFASFNRGITHDNRKALLDHIKKQLKLNENLPEDFDGIPVANNQKTWFFSFKKEREPDAIESLWNLARKAVIDQVLDQKLFERCLNIRQIRLPKLTMGLFWLQPERFFPFDSRSKKYLSSHGIHLKSNDYTGYIELLKNVKSNLGDEFAKISREAYLYVEDNDEPSGEKSIVKETEKSYWWLNSNPKV